VKFSFYDYELQYRQSRKKRRGFLIKVHFRDRIVGYADCHPWLEFGDAPIAQQKQSLLSRRLTPLSAQSLYFARLDAEARAEKRSLFKGLSVPESHYLVAEFSGVDFHEITQFSHVKIKVGDEPEREAEKLKELPKCKWRLDFNSKLTKAAFFRFLDSLSEHLHRIDYCEDPFPFDAEAWNEAEQKFGVDLAADFEMRNIGSGNFCPKIIVIKPAIQAKNPYFGKPQRLVVTSYLDHPLGQATAAYTAAKVAPGEVAGLLSHTVYEENIFSQDLSHGSKFNIPPGTGFGFDHLLEKLVWRDD